MMRSRAMATGGTMILVTASVYLLLYAVDPFELGDEFRSTTGAVLCVAGVAAGMGLLAAAFVQRKAEKRERAARSDR